jgi:hypothetical protein
VTRLGDRRRWQCNWRESEEKEERKEEEERLNRMGMSLEGPQPRWRPAVSQRRQRGWDPTVHRGAVDLPRVNSRVPTLMAPSYPPTLPTTLALYHRVHIRKMFLYESICEKNS